MHVGQCGNQVGSSFWNLLLLEHEKTPDNDPALSSFFYFQPSTKQKASHVMKARALLIDMECGPLTETMRGPLGALFDETQVVTSSTFYSQAKFLYKTIPIIKLL